MNGGYSNSGHTAVEPAPGELDLVRRFVNTLDVEVEHEELSSPAALTDWLRENGLLGQNERANADDLEAALDVREAIRSMLLSNNGEPVDTDAIERLDRAASDSRLLVRFAAGGRSSVGPQAKGVDGALGAILARVHEAMADGTWERLKVCPADDCLWAFYDTSRNRSRRWCQMEVCGNRSKVRTYRALRR
jgi:predicted RNA-binding Zn ribbon-like protein